MRSNIGLWWLLLVFFIFIDVVYVGWNILANPELDWYNAIDWTGSVALLFGGFMSAMIGFYISRVSKATGGVLPEDSLTADIDDGDPEMGEFSPWSWWPLVLAGSVAFGAIGLAVGSWMIPIGLGIFAVAIVGWVFEYYRGNFAR